MSFLFYDITFLVLFSLFIIILLYTNRKRVKREGLLILYKSKFGVELIRKIGEKHKKFLNSIEYFVVALGYFSMIVMVYLLFKLVYIFFTLPAFVKAVKIPPIVPLIPYLPQIFKADFLPPFYFTYWIIVLAVTAICHEFFHGIFSKSNGVKILSTGFAFLGPFTGAFVEPDEKKVEKLKTKKQLAILTSGSFANWLVTILFFIIMWGFFAGAYQESGVIFNSYAFKVVNSSEIQMFGENVYLDFDGGMNLTEARIGNKTFFLKNTSEEGYFIAYEDSPALNAGLKGVIVEIDNNKITKYKDLSGVLSELPPNKNVLIKTEFDDTVKEYNITLGEKNNKSYLGIILFRTDGLGILNKVRDSLMFFREPNTYYAPKYFGDLTIFIYNLFWWMVFVNLSVALVNMLPLGIFDGGRVFYLTMLKLTGSEKAAKKIFGGVTYFLIFIFILLTLVWFFI